MILPKASIIICFYNEHFETLMRSIHSIIDRTELQYLREIILIDDYSDLDNLHDNVLKAINGINQKMRQYEEMIETNNVDFEGIVDYINDDNALPRDAGKTQHLSQDGFNVKLFRTSKREGLIRARLFGAENSVGDVSFITYILLYTL